MQSILWMLIQTLASLLASACLLRAYARWQGVSPFGNPLVGFAHALTQWLVRPLGMVLKHQVNRFRTICPVCDFVALS